MRFDAEILPNLDPEEYFKTLVIQILLCYCLLIGEKSNNIASAHVEGSFENVVFCGNRKIL